MSHVTVQSECASWAEYIALLSGVSYRSWLLLACSSHLPKACLHLHGQSWFTNLQEGKRPEMESKSSP